MFVELFGSSPHAFEKSKSLPILASKIDQKSYLLLFSCEVAEGPRYFYKNNLYFEADHILKKPNDRRHVYEVIPPNVQCKLFFDVDFKEKKEDDFLLICNVISKLLTVLKLPTIRYILLSASNQEKSSFHLIFPSVIFMNLIQLKEFVTKNFSEFSFLDLSVNTSYRNFRCYLSSKFNQNRPFILHSHSFPFKLSNHQIFFLSFITAICLPHSFCIYPNCPDPSYKNPHSTLIHPYLNKNNQTTEFVLPAKIINFLDDDAYASKKVYFKNSNMNSYYIHRQTCPYIKRKHKHNNGSIRHYLNNDAFFYYCFDDECKKQFPIP